MSTLKIRWHVVELANVRSLYDVQKVYRSVDPAGPWTLEVTGPGTRVPLVAGVEDYLFDDVGGLPSAYYAVTYFNSGTLAESGLSDPMRADVSGYLTIDEVRDEGFPETLYPDSRVAYAIELASALIDRITGQWFEPRVRTFRLDVRGGQRGDAEVPLNVPVIALTGLSVLGQAQDLAGFLVYNRHLTQGLLSPDDRQNPHLQFREDRDARFWRLYEPLMFPRGPGTVEVSGVFGYTELGPGDVPGETEPGSQVPSSYGQTPAAIKRACVLLTARYLPTVRSGAGEDIAMRARLTGESTRDQSYSLAAPSAADASYGMTGVLEADRLLEMFVAPLAIGAVG